jgi:hypothetical protein
VKRLTTALYHLLEKSPKRVPFIAFVKTISEESNLLFQSKDVSETVKKTVKRWLPGSVHVPAEKCLQRSRNIVIIVVL